MRHKILVSLFAGILFTGCSASSTMTSTDTDSAATSPSSTNARTVSPGAPGESSRLMSADEINDTAALAYTDADVHFMSGMIAHHAQALEMTALVADRTERQDLHMLAKRIDVSQTSEIKLMQKWLRDRNETVPEATSMHMMGGKQMLMPGMLTTEDMASLRAAEGDDFYKQFLTYMIGHHEGAITMVNDLLATPGAGQDTYVFRFATDVDVDQRMEIARMQDMLDGLR